VRRGGYQGRTRDARKGLSHVGSMKNLICELPHLRTFNTSGASISVYLFRHGVSCIHYFFLFNSKQAARSGDQ